MQFCLLIRHVVRIHMVNNNNNRNCCIIIVTMQTTNPYAQTKLSAYTNMFIIMDNLRYNRQPVKFELHFFLKFSVSESNILNNPSI